jgi:hypothetical protein
LKTIIAMFPSIDAKKWQSTSSRDGRFWIRRCNLPSGWSQN